jgi:hypothetical protein
MDRSNYFQKLYEAFVKANPNKTKAECKKHVIQTWYSIKNDSKQLDFNFQRLSKQLDFNFQRLLDQYTAEAAAFKGENCLSGPVFQIKASRVPL